MHTITFVATATGSVAHSHSVTDALPHLAGMLMVLATLAILWGVCAFTAKLVKILAPEPSAPARVTVSPAAAVPAPDAGISPEILAVIAAAAAATLGKSHRIVSIKPTSTSWERAGRQSVLTSHRIR